MPRLTEKDRRKDAIDGTRLYLFEYGLDKMTIVLVLFGGVGIVGLLVYGRYVDLLLATLALGVTTFAVMAGNTIDKARRRSLLARQTGLGRSLHVAYRAYIFAVLAMSGYLVFRYFSLSFPTLREGDEALYYGWILCLVITSAPGIIPAWKLREWTFAGIAIPIIVLVNCIAAIAVQGDLDEWGGLAMVYVVGFCVAFGVSLLPSRPLPAPPT